MAKLLHIAASPRHDRSYSLQVAASFIAAYREAHPNDAVETIDLWTYKLPSFDGETIAAKYAVLGGDAHTAVQAEAWSAVRQIADGFKTADKLLFSVPMWNFGIPYVLKHYIDVITQPGLTFAWSPEHGFEGLVTGRPAVIVSASAGAYHEGSGAESADFERPYLEHWLRFIGFTDVRSVAIAPTTAEPAALRATQDAASLEAVALARSV